MLFRDRKSAVLKLSTGLNRWHFLFEPVKNKPSKKQGVGEGDVRYYKTHGVQTNAPQLEQGYHLQL